MAFTKKSFFFIRHGQTDHNRPTFTRTHRTNASQEVSDNVPLNETGFFQANQARRIVANLPIGVVCHSPLIRAVQTKDIVISNTAAYPHIEIDELRECNFYVWEQMTRIHDIAQLNFAPRAVRDFLDRVIVGINASLKHDSPTLIVAHGGVYRAMTLLMGISDLRYIDNCEIVQVNPNGEKWICQRLEQPNSLTATF